MAWIAAAAMALYGAYEGKRSKDQQERTQDEAINYAKNARHAASQQMGGGKIYGAAEEYFPGLVAPPTAYVEAKNKLNTAGEEAMGKVASAKNPKKLKYWQHQVKRDQRQSDKLERTINPYQYLEQNNMAGSPTPLNTRTGNPLSSTTAPLHGGVDPTNLPTFGMGNNTGGGTPGVPDANGGAPVPGQDTTPAQPPASGGYGPPPPMSGGTGGTQPSAGNQRRTNREAKKDAKRQRKLDKIHANDPTYTPNVDDSRSGQVYPSQLVMQHLMDQLQNPGRLESETYQRAQDQSSEAYNAASAAGTARVMGAGADPRSGIGQITQENALLNFGKERNEAARDYSIAQEDLRRRDIQQGMEDYTNFLNTIFGLQGKRSNAKAGGPSQAYNYNTAAGGSAAAMGESASQMGNALSNYRTGGSGTPTSTDASSTTDTGSVANRMS